MKKYNSFLGAFFSGDNGQGGYNAAYKKSALASLYNGQLDPNQQNEVAANLSRVDPEAANKWQEDIVKQSANLLVTLGKDNPLAVQAWQTRIKPNLSRIYGAQADALPDVPDDNAFAIARQIAGGAGMQQSQDPAAVREIDLITDRLGLKRGTPEYAQFVKTQYKLEAPAANWRYGETPSGLPNRYRGDEYQVYNPATKTWDAYGGEQPQAGGQQGSQPISLEQINQIGARMRRDGGSVEEVNAWKDQQYALWEMANGMGNSGAIGSTGGQNPPPRPTVAGPTPSASAANNPFVKPEAPKGTYRPATADEMRAAGLPDGSSAQIGPDGKLDVINKPTPATSKQDTADAVKLYAQIPALKRRAMRVAEASKKLGVMGVDGGPIDQYALRFTEGGSELESSVGQLRASLLPLVRVPGVGSQSDLEARMDSLQYPDASQPPAVRQRNIEELSLFINDLEKALANVAKGQQAQPAQQGQPVRIRGAEDYNRLPSGARYIDPNGTLRVKK